MSFQFQRIMLSFVEGHGPDVYRLESPSPIYPLGCFWWNIHIYFCNLRFQQIRFRIKWQSLQQRNDTYFDIKHSKKYHIARDIFKGNYICQQSFFFFKKIIPIPFKVFNCWNPAAAVAQSGNLFALFAKCWILVFRSCQT